MSEYKRIAVAVDGSQESLEAVKEAMDIAKDHGVETVAILTVVSERGYTATGDKAMAERGERETKMVPQAMELLDRMGIKNELVMLHGRPAEEIVRYVRDSNVDLLIIAEGLYHRIRKRQGVGGVSGKILAVAPCPVLVVKMRRSQESREGKEEHHV